MLFVDQSGQLGGAELSLLPLVTTLAHRSEVLLLSDGPFRERLEALNVTVHLSLNARAVHITRDAVRPSWIFALPGILRQGITIARHARRFDIVVLNTQKALVLGALGKPFHRRKTVLHLRDIMSREHFGPLQRSIVKWATRCAVDHVVANSHATADALAALLECDAAAIPVVHNGIDVSQFDSLDDTDRCAVRAQLGLPAEARVVGLFGRLAAWKGQHVAIQALARLPGVHLVLVGAALFGEHAYEAALKDEAERLGVAGRVHFAGFQEDIPRWMRAVDLIVHASTLAEPFGRVIIEGMAAGRAVIATASGGVVEILRHAENGWLVAPGDAEALAHAIDTLFADPALAARLVAQAHTDVRAHFSQQAYVAKMNQIIQGIEYGRTSGAFARPASR